MELTSAIFTSGNQVFQTLYQIFWWPSLILDSSILPLQQLFWSYAIWSLKRQRKHFLRKITDDAWMPKMLLYISPHQSLYIYDSKALRKIISCLVTAAVEPRAIHRLQWWSYKYNYSYNYKTDLGGSSLWILRCNSTNLIEYNNFTTHLALWIVPGFLKLKLWNSL